MTDSQSVYCLLVQISKHKIKQKLTNLKISAQPRHCGLRRLWGWKHRQEAAERQAAGDSSVWPRGLSLQMAVPGLLLRLLSSASLTAPEWLYDSSTIKPSANQPQNTRNGCTRFSIRGVKSWPWVFMGVSDWQLISIAKQWIRTMAVLFGLKKKKYLRCQICQIFQHYSSLYLMIHLYYTIISSNLF